MHDSRVLANDFSFNSSWGIGLIECRGGWGGLVGRLRLTLKTQSECPMSVSAS
jgi:hypothetical protein